MPELDEITYSRDETIHAIRAYYGFLTSMYLPESRIVEAPAEGWPGITIEKYRSMGKTDEVIELLRRLPFINIEAYEDEPKAAPFCQFADYRFYVAPEGDKKEGRAIRIRTESYHLMENVPPHVVGIAAGSEYNPVMLLDTELGIISWYECRSAICWPSRLVIDENGSRIEVDDDDPNDPFIELINDPVDEYAPENEQEWRECSGTWAIVDFFEMLKRQFRKLNFIPINEKTVVDVWTDLGEGTDGMVTELQQIWREHGWPARSAEDLARFDKTACLAKIREVVLTKYLQFTHGEYWQE